MEEKREETHQQQQIGEENPSKEVVNVVEGDKSFPPGKENEIADIAAGDEGKQEERVIPMIEENQLLESTKKEKDGNEVGITVDNQVMKAEKRKQGSKQSLKAKPTIPQPFSFSTEKRMSREHRGPVDLSSENLKGKPRQRHGSMDFRNSHSQPSLYRSVSFSHKDKSSPNARETCDIKVAKSINGTSTTSSNRPRVAAAEHIQTKIVNAEKNKDKALLMRAESRLLKGTDKKQQTEGKESGNLQKSSNFKALPLPRFYQKKETPPKSDAKKNLPTSVSKAERNKTEEKIKRPSKTITNGAKETITKLLTSTRKVLNPSKVTTKGIVSTA